MAMIPAIMTGIMSRRWLRQQCDGVGGQTGGARAAMTDVRCRRKETQREGASSRLREGLGGRAK